MGWNAIELDFSEDGKTSLNEINSKLRYQVRYLTRGGLGERIEAAYFGFDSTIEPTSFLNWYRQKYPGCQVDVRPSTGRTIANWEVKVSRHDRLAESISAWLEKQRSQREFGRSRPDMCKGKPIS